MPNPANVASSGLSSKKTDREDYIVKEIADLESFKMVLNTAREAMASALPWNRSVSTIVGLMQNTSYLQEDLSWGCFLSCPCPTNGLVPNLSLS